MSDFAPLDFNFNTFVLLYSVISNTFQAPSFNEELLRLGIQYSFLHLVPFLTDNTQHENTKTYKVERVNNI